MPIEPLALYRTVVAPDWIDYNGHMNVAYYLLAFDRASDAVLDHIGLGAAYRHDTNHSIYVLEAHVTYDREVKEGDPLAFTTQIIDADAKRLHYFHRMYHADEGYLAATNELMALHVDLGGPRSAAMPAAAQAAIERILVDHRQLPPPDQLGRRIGIKHKG